MHRFCCYDNIVPIMKCQRVLVLAVCLVKLLFLLAGPTLRPFCDRPFALTQEGRSLVDDVCKCVHD